jgi:cold shock protein
MPTTATVSVWSEEEGWGVIDSPETPGGCWASFSHIAAPGYRSLVPGQVVLLEWEAADQDGYAFRAVRVRLDEGLSEAAHPESPSAGYSSTLSLSFDEPAG